MSLSQVFLPNFTSPKFSIQYPHYTSLLLMPQTPNFHSGQRFIGISSPLTMISTLVTIWLVSHYVHLPDAPDIVGRLGIVASSWAVLAFMVFALTAHIGNLRFLSPVGINPLDVQGDPKIAIYSRILQNTLEQSFVFSLLALVAAIANNGAVGFVPVATVTFVIGRILFTIGYLHGWQYRAPGMAMTFASNIALLIVVGKSFL